ncbi:M10 family metallopeptidase C-terminal domain-containing protein [Dapis sp. BLCC M172]|uniref:M10 family metallopeptidase C-terminal domain-containing protein n=1 Tax=Dapis sp. BLCC M172 TaxID=2975281 RepID=UPI003CF70CC6
MATATGTDPNGGTVESLEDPAEIPFELAEPTPNIINGTSGMDTIEGTPGDDIITAFEGADVLTGGDGNDIFVYTQLLDQHDELTDFQSGIDKLDFSILLGNTQESNFSTAFPQGTAQDAIDNFYIIPYDLGLYYGIDVTWFAIAPDGNTDPQYIENIVVLNEVSSINPDGNVFDPNTDMIV